MADKINVKGNSLFNSLSVLLCGTISGATELRHRMAVELTLFNFFHFIDAFIAVCVLNLETLF